MTKKAIYKRVDGKEEAVEVKPISAPSTEIYLSDVYKWDFETSAWGIALERLGNPDGLLESMQTALAEHEERITEMEKRRRRNALDVGRIGTESLLAEVSLGGCWTGKVKCETCQGCLAYPGD